MNLKPTTPAEVQEAVKNSPRLLPRGSGSKPPLSTPANEAITLEMTGLSGVLEYEPGEFTFTALAGTPVAEVNKLLLAHGQYLPFDPLLAEKGATLGGVVAADTSGPGRYRFGGVRDFLIGIRFVDGQGQLVRGGGKVVKNSAGFDLPKLMVGSIGRLGVLTEVSFKVFPAPEAYSTLQVDYETPQQAVAAVQKLTTSQLEMDVLDFEPPGRLLIRLGGLVEALPGRLAHMKEFLAKQPDEGIKAMTIIDGDRDQTLWQQMNALAWAPPGWGVVKAPLTLSRVLVLEAALEGQDVERRYSVGGNVAWLAWPGRGEPTDANFFFNELEAVLTRLDLAGAVIWGPPGKPFLGLQTGEALLRRVKQALDPSHRFLEV